MAHITVSGAGTVWKNPYMGFVLVPNGPLHVHLHLVDLRWPALPLESVDSEEDWEGLGCLSSDLTVQRHVRSNTPIAVTMLLSVKRCVNMPWKIWSCHHYICIHILLTALVVFYYFKFFKQRKRENCMDLLLQSLTNCKDFMSVWGSDVWSVKTAAASECLMLQTEF